VLVVALVAYALVVFLAWRFQDRLAFPGPSAPLPSPAASGIPDGAAVSTLTADGVELRGWFLPPKPAPAERSRAPGLFWFYGNMETVHDLAPILRALRPPGIAVLILDYRGYGASGGEATEEGLYRDADAAWAYLAERPEIDPERLAVYGRSLGSAVALYLASRHPVRAVVLDSPFTSAREMANRHYAIIPNGLLRLRLDNLQRAAGLAAPLLVIHGAEDAVAPLAMGRAVADTAPQGRLLVIEGAGHNDTYAVGGERYREAFHEFLRQHLQR
jgi:hypothetical protein